MRPSLPTVKAAAASPNCSSCGPEAWVRRLSAATNSVSPAAAPRRAFSRPEVPARCEAVKSMVTTDSPKFSAVARMPAFCRSLNGSVVEAKVTAATAGGAPASSRAGVRQSRAASTPMVRLSSSQLQMARSPRARPLIAGLNQALASAIALRLRRSRGT